MRVPNLFIVGAPRCGTTAMFEFLGRHPDVFPAPIKEPYYFLPVNTRSEEEYLALFGGASRERWLLEATPHYLSSRDAPQLIREFSPDARAIVMVRDPVELVHSLHDLRRLHQREPYDLRTALARRDAEPRYWNIARLGEQLERVLGVFPREDVHVVVYDDFVADNEREYRRVLEFLEIDPSFTPRFRIVNPSREGRSRAVQRTLWRSDGVVRTVARAVLPRSLRQAGWHTISHLNRRPRPRGPLDAGLASFIWKRLEPDVALLSSLLDRDLVDLWRR